MRIWRVSGRDRLGLLVALVAPLALAAILVPFRGSFPNTDAALAMLLVVVTRVLALESCRFQYGAAGLGRPARMQHDGTVITAQQQPWDVDAEGFPRAPTPNSWSKAVAFSRAGS